MNTKKKNAFFGRYPCCDLLNNALYECGALENATITVSNIDLHKDEWITKSITINN